MLYLAIYCTLFMACNPQNTYPICAPLPIVEGYETGIAEGGKIRLRVPAHSSEFAPNCQQIRSIHRKYYWNSGKLLDYSKDYLNGTLPKEFNGRWIRVYWTKFQILSDIQIRTPKPWLFENSVRHSKYPLEYYPQIDWIEQGVPPVQRLPDAVFGVIGTHNPFTNSPFTTYCDISRGANKVRDDVVYGDFWENYGDAKCRGHIVAIKGEKVAGGLIDVWANEVPYIDQIYLAVIADLQTYIQED